nr:hypothetical protein [Pandoravirus belohorizontensis]
MGNRRQSKKRSRATKGGDATSTTTAAAPSTDHTAPRQRVCGVWDLVVGHLGRAALDAAKHVAKHGAKQRDDVVPHQIVTLYQLGGVCWATYEAVHRARVLVDVLRVMDPMRPGVLRDAATRAGRRNVIFTVCCNVTPGAVGNVPPVVTFHMPCSPFPLAYVLGRGRVCGRPRGTMSGQHLRAATEYRVGGAPYAMWLLSSAVTVPAADQIDWRYDPMVNLEGDEYGALTGYLHLLDGESKWHLSLVLAPDESCAVISATVVCDDGPKSQCRRLL